MVAVISTNKMEKDGLPVIMQPEAQVPASRDKKHVMLTSWASVATALLIVMLIGGAFYVADLKTRECKGGSQTNTSQHNTKDYKRTYDDNGKKTEQDFHLDENDKSELMVKKSDDGNIQMITATDYKKKISATYIPSTNQCLLLAGEDMDWLTDWNEDEKDKTVDVLKEKLEEENFKVSSNKVTDLSILPKDIKPYCQGKATYWLQPADADSTEMEEGAARQKRAICFWIRVRRCYGRFCFYVNLYRCY